MTLTQRKLSESFSADILFMEYEAGKHESGIKLCDIALGLIPVINNSPHKKLAKMVWQWAELNRSLSGHRKPSPTSHQLKRRTRT